MIVSWVPPPCARWGGEGVACKELFLPRTLPPDRCHCTDTLDRQKLYTFIYPLIHGTKNLNKIEESIDIYFLDKGALIIGEVGFADMGPLIQRALLVLLEQRLLDQGAFICKHSLQIIKAPLSRKYMSNATKKNDYSRHFVN